MNSIAYGIQQFYTDFKPLAARLTLLGLTMFALLCETMLLSLVAAWGAATLAPEAGALHGAGMWFVAVWTIRLATINLTSRPRPVGFGAVIESTLQRFVLIAFASVVFLAASLVI